MVVTTVGGNVPNNRADVVAQVKKNAAPVGKTNKDGSVSVYVDDIGEEVLLGTMGLGHGLRRISKSQTDPTWAVTLKAGEIIKNAIRINEVTPSKNEASGAYVLIGVAKNSVGDRYVVRFVVNKFANELTSMDVLYAIIAKKEDRLRLMRPGFQGPVTDPTVSIAELLKLVNQHFPDILPEDVLKHFGYDSRPGGELGKDALYKLAVWEDTSAQALLPKVDEITVTPAQRNNLGKYLEQLEKVDAQKATLKQQRNILCSSASLMLCQFPSLRAAPFSTPLKTYLLTTRFT